MQRPDVVVVVPEETLQFWRWPVRIGCTSVAMAILCLLIFALLRGRRQRTSNGDAT